MTWRELYRLSDLWVGEMVGLECDNTPILLINVEGTVHAYADRCAHKAVKVSGGTIIGHVLRCPAHGWEYDITNGDGINPRHVCLKSYAVAIRDGTIFVDLTNTKGQQHESHENPV